MTIYQQLPLHSVYDNDGDAESRDIQKEMRVLHGIVTHLLPKVGHHVQTLDLAYGKAVTNEVVSLLFLPLAGGGGKGSILTP